MTVFAGHHQPLQVWILCLYLMGLNLSNRQIAQELGLNKDDVHAMTAQLRVGTATSRHLPRKTAVVSGLFQFVHNARQRGKGLLKSLLDALLA